MAKTSDLTPVALQGYRAPLGMKCPLYDSSPSGMAWLVGQWLQATGRTEPRHVRAGRGYTIHANDMLISVKEPKAIERIN
jgi:hypothetical protein